MKTKFSIHLPARRPRRKALLAGAAGMMLALAGVAIADTGTSSTAAVAATFSATSLVKKDVRTCTGADGTYEVTHATFTGTSSSSDAHLNGTLQLDVKSVFNTTTNLGWLEGKLKVESSTAGESAKGKLSAVNSGGQLSGFVKGDVSEPHGKLLANFSAGFSTTGGFSSGQLGGGGTTTNTAIVASGECTDGKPGKGPKPPKPPKPQKHDKHD
jgi:hypothetical protein